MKIASLILAAALQGFHQKSFVSARSEASSLRNGQPEEIRSVNGLLEVTLNVDLVTTTALNRTAPGYNNGAVGPTLRAKPGDKVRITLVNNLEPSTAAELDLLSFAMTPVVDDKAKEINQTLIMNRLQYPTGNLYLPREEYWGKSLQNLHFHGLMVDPTIDDSRIFIDGGGKTMVYEWDIQENSPSLFGFYHNHIHGTATYSFLSGQYGFFVIEDEATDPVPSYIASAPQASETFLLLSESKTYDDSVPQDYVGIVMDFDWDHVTNGKLNPTLTYKKGEHVHFRTVNAGVEPAMYLSIENHTLIPYAMDGYPVPDPSEVDTLALDVGVRAEFLVKFDTPGTYQFKRGPWNVGIEGPLCKELFMIELEKCISFDKEQHVATIVVVDEEIETNEMENPVLAEGTKPSMDPYLEDLLQLPNAGSRTITFNQAHTFPLFQIPYEGPFIPPGTGFGVNNLLFNPNYFHGDIVGGTCETWTVKAVDTVPIHTFHSHSVAFYVMAMDGVELDDEERFWRDTMNTGFNFTATVCFPKRETESYLNVHCHMPNHQDIGMAAFYKLLPSDDIENAVTPGPTPLPTSQPTAATAPVGTPTELPSSGKAIKASLLMTPVVLLVAEAFLC